MLGKSLTTGNLTVSQLCALIFEVSFFSFSQGHFNSQEKLKTMLMQNFGVTSKEHYIWYVMPLSAVVNLPINPGPP